MTRATHGIVYREIGRYKYMLTVPYQYQTGIGGRAISTAYYALHNDGRLMILDGYAWDGASGPARDTETFMRASLVHDCLYQMMREGHLDKSYRKHADKIMQAIAVEDGMNKVRAWYTYHAVRIFGGAHNRRQK